MSKICENCLVFSVVDKIFGERIAVIIVFDDLKFDSKKSVDDLKELFNHTQNTNSQKRYGNKSIPLSKNGKKIRIRKSLLDF